jgi:hypothetical protein
MPRKQARAPSVPRRRAVPGPLPGRTRACAGARAEARAAAREGLPAGPPARLTPSFHTIFAYHTYRFEVIQWSTARGSSGERIKRRKRRATTEPNGAADKNGGQERRARTAGKNGGQERRARTAGKNGGLDGGRGPQPGPGRTGQIGPSLGEDVRGRAGQDRDRVQAVQPELVLPEDVAPIAFGQRR